MWNNLKYKIGCWFFSDIKGKLETEREAFKRISADYKAGIENMSEQLKKEVESLDVVSLVRAQLKGFDPKLLNDTRDLPEILGDIESQTPFLAKMKTLQDTPELWQLISYLERNQILFATKEAPTLEAINFARATINGWSLLREEVDRLATIYAERHAAQPEFDEHEVV